MREFAKLLDKLYYTHGNLEKAVILKDYLQHTPDPDRGYALGIIAGTLNFNFFKRGLIVDLISERVDLVLYEMSYDYVGETAETVAHLWPASPDMLRLNRVPSLSEIVEHFGKADKEEVKNYLRLLLDNMTPSERWALIKLGTGNLRIGLSARTAKQVLADYASVDVHEIEEIWHGLEPPYENLFAWLEKRAEKPAASAKHNYIPVMLSHPLEEDEAVNISHIEFAAEWKYDGIRVQVISDGNNTTLFSRSGDNISGAFPDLISKIKFNAVLDGELLVRRASGIASFNDLQQRLNRKKPSKKMIDDYPAYVIIYDALFLDGEDIRSKSYSERRAKLKDWWAAQQIDYMEISEILEFKNKNDKQFYVTQDKIKNDFDCPF